MFLRLTITMLVCSAWGCESISSTHRTSDGTQSNQPKVTLTSLSQVKAPDLSSVTERMVIPDGATDQAHTQKSSKAEPFPTIYFPFDSWEITSEVQERLDATAKWMTHFSTYGLTIEGHTDIRGSESYNMVLGVKRAKAVKDYLANMRAQSPSWRTIFHSSMQVCRVGGLNVASARLTVALRGLRAHRRFLAACLSVSCAIRRSSTLPFYRRCRTGF